MTWLWIALALVMGVCVAFQGTFNSALAARIGAGEALLANTAFVAAGCLTVFFTMSSASRFSISRMSSAPWYEYAGGPCGFAIIFLAIVLFPRLGAGLTLALAIGAQLVCAIAIDHFGFMGVPEHAINVQRILGVVLLAAGAALVKIY